MPNISQLLPSPFEERKNATVLLQITRQQRQDVNRGTLHSTAQNMSR